ncbi:MAG: N-acetyltransferase [Burkholderiales bacterium]|nr:N-acetyltransferase [Burkholderiales bacterium]
MASAAAGHGPLDAEPEPTAHPHVTVEIIDSLASVAAADWNRLAGGEPFLSHEFFSALHESGCATPTTGWTPQFLLLRGKDGIAAAMPLYLKDHSYGEYVFDWAWADAYHRHGLEYYPKLLSAVPFTPVTGPRVLGASPHDRDRLVAAALGLARSLRVSSLHCLFPTRDEAERLRAHGMILRHAVQFHWSNPGYAGFEEFLGAFTHDKRKKIRQERRKVTQAGISFEWREGTEITEGHWAFFNRCYRQTYREHHSTPYLNLEFFLRIGRTLPRHLVLVVAHRGARPVGAALFVRAGDRLCGRSWGAVEHHPALHFETCYYQAIEYCIARRIGAFEGGSRGEHKMARGLMPVETFSAHWLARPQFARAIEEFLAREASGIARYVDELAERNPFRRHGANPAPARQAADGGS